MPSELSRRDFALGLGAFAMVPLLTGRRTFTAGEIDSLRKSVPISRIIGRTVTLERCGCQYRAFTPFAVTRHPDFLVDDKHGFFHCFATGLHGDVFAFLMKTENLTHPDAVVRVAREAARWAPPAA